MSTEWDTEDMRVLFLACLASPFFVDSTFGDPAVKWKTTLSASRLDRIVAAAADRDGNILVTGETSSRSFPATGLQKRPAGSTLLLDGLPQDIPLDGEVFWEVRS